MLDKFRHSFLGRLKHPFRHHRARKHEAVKVSQPPTTNNRQDAAVQVNSNDSTVSSDPSSQRPFEPSDEHFDGSEPPQVSLPENFGRDTHALGSDASATSSERHLSQGLGHLQNYNMAGDTQGGPISSYQTSTSVDRTAHVRPAVVEEHVQPHVHTVYEVQRTRSFHIHEHRLLIQPVIDDTGAAGSFSGEAQLAVSRQPGLAV